MSAPTRATAAAARFAPTRTSACPAITRTKRRQAAAVVDQSMRDGDVHGDHPVMMSQPSGLDDAADLAWRSVPA
jgi:hypothetical protein